MAKGLIMCKAEEGDTCKRGEQKAEEWQLKGNFCCSKDQKVEIGERQKGKNDCDLRSGDPCSKGEPIEKKSYCCNYATKKVGAQLLCKY